MRFKNHQFVFMLLGCGLSTTAFANGNIVNSDPVISKENPEQDFKFKVNGTVRTNYRDEHWDSDNNGKFLFDLARIDVKAEYKQFFFDGNYVLQDDRRAIEHAFIGAKLNSENTLTAGYVYKPFAIYPYPQNAWSFQIPFFLGYGDSVAPGIDWHYFNQDYDFHAGFFPTMMTENLRFSPELGDYQKLANTIAATQSKQANSKRNQVNFRLARKFTLPYGKQEFGASASFAQLHNSITDDDGKYSAFAVHSINNYNQWKLQTSIIHYDYDPKNPTGVSSDSVLFQANGFNPAYLIASKATVYNASLSYKIPVSKTSIPYLTSISIYDDYSIMVKDKKEWSDSQMNTFGVQFNALPFIVWVDLTYGKNIPSLGGKYNSTGYTSTTSQLSNDWVYRTNINIGYYF
ncbi:hypothetical protein GCM10027155_06770 [Acinetobacter apis]|uniref:Phosphate-selective porin O and P n=1 Tax=Acinetobacter apis TaxID=1229165 RepID=A0A217EE41_9GAMM|nr:hypothetical protein [Acinetobacter apis]SNQ28761.1 hypothetical protein SAMN05444584_0686 [Acinetobacter apis]